MKKRIETKAGVAVGRFLNFCGGWFATLAAVVIAQLTPTARASDSPVPAKIAADIAAAAIESAGQLDSSKIRPPETAEADFIAAVDLLQSHLASTTSPGNAQAWLDYLSIDPVTEAIDAGERDSELARRASRVSQRATGIHPGLEVDAVRRVREAASEYASALRFRRRDVVVSALQRQLNRFADQWSAEDGPLTADDVATLRLLLDLLEQTDQPVSLVDRARDRFGSPNVRILISQTAVAEALSRDINERSPVRDCILGTRIVGDASLRGRVDAALLPSTGSVRIQVALSAAVVSNSLGYNGPVRLQTTGTGQVHSTRVIEISENGLNLEPVATAGSLQTQINKIEHPLRLVRRIARRRAAKQKPLAQQIARGRMISRVSEEFTQQTDQAVAGPDPNLLGRLETWLQRLDLRQPERTIGSTRQAVYLSATFRQGNELASPIPPPPAAIDSDATFQLHESLIDNTLGAIFAGRTMSRNELAALAEKSGRGAASPESLDDEKNFEIDFDPIRPVIFEARDGQLRVGIRGTRFAEGSRQLRRQLEVAATYRPEIADDGRVVLQRVGETEIRFPGRSQLSVSEAGLRGSIQEGLAGAFPERLFDADLPLPGNVTLPGALAKALFRARRIEAEQGWLTLALGR